MKQVFKNGSAEQNRVNIGAFDFWLIGASLAAFALTFAFSHADFGFETKLVLFSATVISYLIFCVARYSFYKKQQASFLSDAARRERETEVQNRLFALEEVNEFFGASLKPADMLRLVSSRINELIPFATCIFYVTDEDKSNLTAEHVFGTNAEILKNKKVSVRGGIAGKAFSNGASQIETEIKADKIIFSPQVLKDFQSSIAAPLFRGSEIVGVIQLYGSKSDSFGAESVELLEAVSERVAPIFAGSMAFERSLANALTDSLTTLPNERAFYLVLENQIAESIRFQTERPLTVLSIDVNGFSSFNEKFGHQLGDRFLAFAGSIIKNQSTLR